MRKNFQPAVISGPVHGYQGYMDDATLSAAKAGDAKARELVLERYGSRIQGTARRYQDCDDAVDIEDLEQAGALGLMEALAVWSEGGRFPSYARACIRKAMQRDLASGALPETKRVADLLDEQDVACASQWVPSPARKRARLPLIRRRRPLVMRDDTLPDKQAAVLALVVYPDDTNGPGRKVWRLRGEEIGSYPEISLEQARELRGPMETHEVGLGRRAGPVADPDDDEVSVDAWELAPDVCPGIRLGTIVPKDDVPKMAAAIRELPERERGVIIRRLKGHKQGEIARDLGVDQSRVARIEKRAIRRVRESELGQEIIRERNAS